MVSPRFFALVLVLALAVASAAQTVPPDAVAAAIEATWEQYRGLDEGKNADDIPALAKADPNLFGIAVVTVDGQTFHKGEVGVQFSIQAISQVFTLASVIETAGAHAVVEKIGVDAKGQAFNAIAALEQHQGQDMNPFVDPGAIATTSLVAGETGEDKWTRILAVHEAFAGHKLTIDDAVYQSLAAGNARNQTIARLMHTFGRLYFDPTISTDIYTRQCAIAVNTLDLAVMAATLANGGRNPITGTLAVSPDNVPRILALMAIAGLDDRSGIWLYEVGLPAKSGIGGGIIAVVPGRFGIAAFSPPLDAAGNSVRAQKSIRDLAATLGLNPYGGQAR